MPPVREVARDFAKDRDGEGRNGIILMLSLKLPDFGAELLTHCANNAHTHTHYSHAPAHTRAQLGVTKASDVTRRS